MPLWSTLVVSLSPAVSKISTQLRYKDFDLRSITTPGLRPLIHMSPPVFTRGAWESRQQVNVQVRHSVTPHGHVNMLSPRHFAECSARTRAPQADFPGLGVGQIGQPRCMPQRLHKQMPQIGGCAITSQHIRRDGMGDKNQLIFRNRSARHERSTVAVLSAYEAVCYGVASDHVRNLRIHTDRRAALSAWELACHASLTGPLQVSRYLQLSVSGRRAPALTPLSARNGHGWRLLPLQSVSSTGHVLMGCHARHRGCAAMAASISRAMPSGSGTQRMMLR
jgi:hypothetical protein